MFVFGKTFIFYIFQQSGVHRRQRCGMQLSEQPQQCGGPLTMS